ncbi:MAG: DUF5615 family PIN-like protein [Planctomycetes bacterium]|nr:DUF5615 family PIN-like protein [Planctomycetota bacterium]
MPRATATSLSKLGYEATDVRDVGMGRSSDEDIAAYAKAKRLALLTRDFDFSDVRNYPPSAFFGIVVIDLPSWTSVDAVLDVINEALSQPDLVNQLSGSLLIVEAGRIRHRYR